MRSPPITKDLWGYWTFERNAVVDSPLFVWDYSGANHHGAAQVFTGNNTGKLDPPTYAAGVIGTSVKLTVGDAPSQVIVQYPTPQVLVLTLSTWAWMDEATPDATIAASVDKWTSGYGDFRIFIHDGKVAASFGVIDPEDADQRIFPGPCETLTTDKPFSPHHWHHLALVMNEPDAWLYVDGVEAGHIKLQKSLRKSAIPFLVLGCTRRFYQFKGEADPEARKTLGAWNGRIDETALWTRPLSAAEIRGVCAATLAGKPLLKARAVDPETKPSAGTTQTVPATLAATAPPAPPVAGVVHRPPAPVQSVGRRIDPRILADIGLLFVVLTAGWLAHHVSTRTLRRRLARLESQSVLESERQRMSDDIHDDLGARLAKLSMHTQLALAGGDRAAEHLRTVSYTAQQANLSLDELVWALKPGHDSLASLISYLSNYASEFLEDSGLSLRLDFPDVPDDLALAPNRRHELLLAAKEALTNVIKHAQATEVLLQLRLHDDGITLSVMDNGRGIRPTENGQRNGLRTMCARLERLGGQCTVLPRDGGGTIVELSVPIP